MATARRVFWESVTVLVFVALLIVTWFLAGYQANRQLSLGEDRHRQALATQEAAQETALAGLRSTCEEWGDAQARAQAEAVFRAYVAGIRPAAAARWGRFLNATKDSLLESDRIAFVHLITPRGRILVSTDDAWGSGAQVDERADWARAATALETRASDTPGLLELAGPVMENGRAVATLWLGYDVDAAREATRPAALTAG